MRADTPETSPANGSTNASGSRSASTPIRALILSSSFTAVAYGVMSPTLMTRCMERGASGTMLGLISCIWALPTCLGVGVYPHILRVFGVRRCLSVGAVVSAGTMLLFPLMPNDRVWLFLLLLTGSVYGLFSVATTTWISVGSHEGSLARAGAVYGVITATSYAGSGALFALTGNSGSRPFVIAASAMAASVLPLVYLPSTVGLPVHQSVVRVHAIAKAIPRFLAIGLFAGALETIVWGLLQVFARLDGWGKAETGFVLPTLYWGQVILGYPIGWLADHYNRSLVFSLVNLMTIMCMCALGFWGAHAVFWFVVFVCGGVVNASYTLGLAILSESCPQHQRLAANSAFLSSYALGTVAVPPAVGSLMFSYGLLMLPATMSCVSAAIIACLFIGRRRWDRTPPQHRGDATTRGTHEAPPPD